MRADSKTNYMELVGRIFNKKSYNPLYFICYVTSKCNMKCDHCFYWNKLNSTKNELSLEEHKKIAENMGKISFLSLTGGEPFLRKDLPKIAETYYINNNVRKIAIPTNGSLPKEIAEGTRYILENCRNASLDINISVDGIGKDHDKIRCKKGSFEKAVESYVELAELKKNFHKLGITILTTFSALNQHKIMDIYDYVKKNLPEAAFAVNLLRGSPRNPLVKGLKIELFEKVTKAIIEDYVKNARFNKNSPLYKISAAKNILRYRLISDVYKRKRFISNCYAGLLSGVMYEDGDVYGCELFSTKIGNIRDYNYDFRRLWGSKQAKEFVKQIKKNKCFCTHECNWTINILFNPRFYPELVFEAIRL